MWKYVCLACGIFICIILPQNVAYSYPTHQKSRNYSSPSSFYNNGPRMINLPSVVDNQILNKWSFTAMKFFDFNRCVTSHIASSEDECFKLNQIQRSQVAVYFGTGQNVALTNNFIRNGKRENFHKRLQKVVAVFPDSSSPKTGGSHDAILVLDPYPNANFGHLVAVFYIDLNVDSRKCKEDHQMFTTGNFSQSFNLCHFYLCKL